MVQYILVMLYSFVFYMHIPIHLSLSLTRAILIGLACSALGREMIFGLTYLYLCRVRVNSHVDQHVKMI